MWDAFARQWGDLLPEQHALVLPSAEGLEIETAVGRGVPRGNIHAVDDSPTQGRRPLDPHGSEVTRD